VISAFRLDQTEDQVHLLDRFRLDILQPLQVALPNDFEIAAAFLVDFIDFEFDVFDQNRQIFFELFHIYVKGLQNVAEETPAFYKVVSKICIFTRSVPEFFERGARSFEKLSELLLSLFARMNLSSKSGDCTEILKYQEFYENLLLSGVWLQSKFPKAKTSTFGTMIDFFVFEISSSSAIWRLCAAFSAISTVLQYFGAILETEQLLQIITACSNATIRSPTNLKPLIRDFLTHSAIVVQNKPEHVEIWSKIVSVLLAPGSDCTAQTVALLLQNSQAPQMATRFVHLIMSRVQQRMFSEEEASNLIATLYHITPTPILGSIENGDPIVNFMTNALK
jgi:hypothetical protein